MKLPSKNSSLFRLWTFLLLCLTLISTQAQEKPNIIFIMTDDQGYGDLACHGHPFLKTPNLDKLFAESTRFTNYHVSPTCAPTRSALMSGRNPFEAGVTHTILERERMALESTTLPQKVAPRGSGCLPAGQPWL